MNGGMEAKERGQSQFELLADQFANVRNEAELLASKLRTIEDRLFSRPNALETGRDQVPVLKAEGIYPIITNLKRIGNDIQGELNNAHDIASRILEDL